MRWSSLLVFFICLGMHTPALCVLDFAQDGIDRAGKVISKTWVPIIVDLLMATLSRFNDGCLHFLGRIQKVGVAHFGNGWHLVATLTTFNGEGANPSFFRPHLPTDYKPVTASDIRLKFKTLILESVASIDSERFRNYAEHYGIAYYFYYKKAAPKTALKQTMGFKRGGMDQCVQPRNSLWQSGNGIVQLVHSGESLYSKDRRLTLEDCNLVLYGGSNTAMWMTKTFHESSSCKCMLEENGELSVRVSLSGIKVWGSDTSCSSSGCRSDGALILEDTKLVLFLGFTPMSEVWKVV